MQLEKYKSSLDEAPRLSTEFLELLKKWLALFCQHYRQELTELGIIGYQIALRGLTVEELDAGCDQALKECDFLPRASEILKRAKASSVEQRFTEMQDSLKASEMFVKSQNWARINCACEVPSVDPEPVPPRVSYAMQQCGGPKALLDTAQEYWVRKRFMEAYIEITQLLRAEGIQTRDGAEKYILKLRGGEAEKS